MSKGYTYTLKIDAEIQGLTAKVDQAKKSMQALIDSGKAPGAEKMFANITQALDNLQKRAAVPINSEATFGAMQKDVAAVGLQLDKLGTVIDNVRNMANSEKLELLPPDERQKIESISAAMLRFAEAQAKAETETQDLIDAEKKLADAQNKLNKAEGAQSDASKKVEFQKKEVEVAKENLAVTKQKIDALKQYKSTMEAYEKAGADKRSKLSTPDGDFSLSAARSAVKGADLQVPARAAEAQAEIEKLTQTYNEQSLALKNAQSTQAQYDNALNKATVNARVASDNVKALSDSAETLRTKFKTDSIKDTNEAFKALRTDAAALGVDLSNIPMDYTEQGATELNQRLLELQNQGLQGVDQSCENVENNLKEVRVAAEETSNAVDQNADAFKRESAAAGEVQGLISRIKYFVGLQGAVILARQALRGAFDTIKELDAAMTEMAVVTDLEIGDYWKQLPNFTENANALGVSILGAYEATTLYLQQGLKMAEAQELSNETLKMARIAGMEASEATDKMTAALRGFNMELNETSAQKVADVYSQLAAITAADVNEIASAMTKTASIASSAGMEFETTAAFLSQIIETTRESAETAGTALKTVIARFQELKKDPAEIGEVDGEVVDANKIETALRSVGVSLRDTSGQFRELDDVFLDLAEKWNTLDTNTQRYIATIAAGSRQQSRFIAMMQDYGRTQELVTAANTSAGASNAQFEKTLDSLESKLAKLKNSWDTFLMSLMNNEVLKIGVDILVALMDTINGVIEAFDQIGLGSVASLGMVVGALVLGTKALNTFEVALRATDANGKRLYTTLGAIGQVGKKAALAPVNGFRNLQVAIRNTQIQQQKLLTLQKSTVGSSTNLKIAQDRVARAQQNLTKTQNTLGASAKSVAAAEKELARAQSDLTFQTGANATMQKEKIALQGMGLGALEAETLALQGHTAQEFADAVATEMNNDLSKEEATQSVLTAWGLQQENNALSLNNMIRNSAILSFLQDLGLRILGKKATDANTKSELKNAAAKGVSTGATHAQTAANVGLLATLWPILVAVLAIMAAIAILAIIIMGIVKAVKNWKANQPGEQLKALEAAATRSKEIAEEAKQAYDDLLTAKDEYDSLENSIEDLTEGTTAWKEAVAELNEKVLELISLYPELVQFLSIAENGVMTIDQAGWDTVINEQQRKTAIASSQAMQDQIAIRDKKKEISGFKTRREEGVVRYYQALPNGEKKYVSASTATRTEKNHKGGSKTIVKSGYHKEMGAIDVLDYGLTGQNQKTLEYLSTLAWGTEEYNKEMVELRKTIGESNTEQQEQLDLFDQTAKKLAELEKEAQAYERQALSSLGSIEAQSDVNYNRIIESLASQYDEIVNSSSEGVEEKWTRNYAQGLWREGNNTPTEGLVQELAKYNIKSQDDEVKDLAALLEAKGGKAYTDEELEDLGSKADQTLVNEIKDLEPTETMREEYVNKLYELQKENATLGNLYSGDLDIDLGAAQKEIDKLEDVNDVVKNALNERVNIVKTAQGDIDKRLSAIFGETTAKTFAGSYEQAKEFLRVYDEMMNGVGEGLATTFSQLFDDLSVEDQENFLEKYSDINWGSSIEGAAALKEMIEGTDKALRDFASRTLYIEKDTYSAVAQMNEAYKSLSEDTLQDLAKDGEITATEMLELAKSNEKVATMMDTTGVSAASLANYYELLEEKTITSYEATTNFIKALDKLNTVSNTVEDSFAFLDTFDISRSQTEIGKQFGEMKDALVELYDMGAYGDQQLEDYILAFLGDTNWKKILKKNNGNMKAAIDDAMTEINTYGSNFYGMWSKLVEKGLEGVSIGVGGEVQFDVNKIGNLDNLKKQIQELGLSKEVADALIADAETYSADFENAFQQIGLKESFETWLSEAFVINGKRIIPEGQVEAMAKQLNTDVNKLKEDLAKNGITVMDLVTEEGALHNDFREDLISQATKDNPFDWEMTYHALLELGLEDEDARTELKNMINSVPDLPVKLNEKTVIASGGLLYETTGEAMEGATVDGLVDGMEDPKVQLANMEQAQQMASSIATGTLAASKTAALASAKSAEQILGDVIKFYNKIAGKLGWENIDVSSTVTENYENSIAQAQKEIDDYYQGAIDKLKAAMNNNTSKEETPKQAIENLTEEYSEAFAKLVKSYLEEESQNAGSVDTKAWENPYDKLYNLNQELNSTIREREKLERKYSRAVEDSSATAQDLANITGDQLKQLKEEALIQKDIAETALDNISKKIAENSEFEGLYSIDTETGTIQVDWEAIDELGWNEEMGEKFEEFISYMEEQVSTNQDALDALEDIEDQTEEIVKRGRDQVSEIYNQVKDGLVKQYENEIEALENVSSAIEDAQSALISKIQEQIDDARQARDNEKTEKSIADKELRLAYLMRDTSGGNALEIAELQKEIEEEKEGYTDSLVDQQLEKLQDANEKAAEQRQEQIELMRAQLNWYQESGKIWEDVKTIVNKGLVDVAEGHPFGETVAGKLATLSNDVTSMNPFEKEDFWTKLEQDAKEGAIHEGFLTVTGDGENETISELAAAVIEAITSKKEEPGAEEDIGGKEDNSGSAGGNWIEYPDQDHIYDSDTTEDPNEGENPNTNLNPSQGNSPIVKPSIDSSFQDGIVQLAPNGDFNLNLPTFNPNITTSGNGLLKNDLLESLFGEAILKYASGGLADYTGPAWLDGTKSKPEIVLNQTDSANFIQLRDILSDILHGTSSIQNTQTTEEGGDNYYDINITVESLGDDYDVEQLADKIKDMIYEDATFRNVNSIHSVR